MAQFCEKAFDTPDSDWIYDVTGGIVTDCVYIGEPLLVKSIYTVEPVVVPV